MNLIKIINFNSPTFFEARQTQTEDNVIPNHNTSNAKSLRLNYQLMIKAKMDLI